MKKGCMLLVLMLVGVMVLPGLLHAQVQDNVLDGIVEMYRTAANGWRDVIMRYAIRLFWLLVLADLAWTFAVLALEQADLQKFVAELIRRIMAVGFFHALLVHSGDWSTAIINSFRRLGAEAGAQGGLDVGISPSNIFDMALRLAGSLTDQVTLSDIGESIARVLTGIIIIVVFAIIAGLLLATLIELYIALNAAIILLGFGGSRWTSDYAVSYWKYLLSVGMKIFAMQLLIGIGQSFISGFFGQYDGSNIQSLVFVGVSIVLLILVKIIPEVLQGVMNGTSVGGAGNALVSAGAAAAGGAVGAALGAGAAVAGGTMAIGEAAKLANASAQASDSPLKPSFGSLMTATAKNLGSSALGDAVGRITGSQSSRHGTMGGRMAARMKEERLSTPPPKTETTNGPMYGPDAKINEQSEDSASNAEDNDSTEASNPSRGFDYWR